jgi:hypothetical protein
MSIGDSTARLVGSDETQGESLLRGSVAFLGGLLFCSAALAAQAVWLHSVAGKKKAS